MENLQAPSPVKPSKDFSWQRVASAMSVLALLPTPIMLVLWFAAGFDDYSTRGDYWPFAGFGFLCVAALVPNVIAKRKPFIILFFILAVVALGIFFGTPLRY